MSVQELGFDIFARDGASETFRRIATTATLSADEMRAAFADETLTVRFDERGFDRVMAETEALKRAAGDIHTSSIWRDLAAGFAEVHAGTERLRVLNTELDRHYGHLSRLRGMGRGLGAWLLGTGLTADAIAAAQEGQAGNGGIFGALGAPMRLATKLGDKISAARGGAPAGSGLGLLFGGLTGAAEGTGLLTIASSIGSVLSGLVGAAGGGGILGAAMFGDYSQYDKLKQRIDAAKQTLATAAPGSRTQGIALSQYETLSGRMQIEFGPLMKGFHDIKGAWDSFVSDTRGVSTSLIGEGLKILADALKQMAPVAKAVGRAMEPLLKGLDRWVRGPDFDKMLHWFAQMGRTLLPDLLGGLARGADGLLHWMEQMSPSARKQMDDWGHILGGIVSIIGDLLQVALPVANVAIPALAKAMEGVTKAFGYLLRAGQNFIPSIRLVWDGIKYVFAEAVDKIFGFVYGLAENMVGALDHITGPLAHFFGFSDPLASAKAGLNALGEAFHSKMLHMEQSARADAERVGAATGKGLHQGLKQSSRQVSGDLTHLQHTLGRTLDVTPSIHIEHLHMRDPQSTLRYLQRRARLGSGSGKVVYGL